MSTKSQEGLVVTKVGLAPPQRSALMKSVYTIARPAGGLAKGLRKHFRQIPSTGNQKVPLSAAIIRSSLEQSLRHLNTNHVEVFALHDPDPAEVGRDEIVRTLEDIVRSGRARAVSVAGKLDAAEAALGHGLPHAAIQAGDDPLAKPIERLRAGASRPFAIVTHSIFGVDGTREKLLRRLASNGQARQRLMAGGYDGPVEKAVADLLLDRAFAVNPEGVVLASMFSEKNRIASLARARRSADPRAITLVDDLFGGRREAAQ